jgi:hypothetical protein
MSLGQSVTRPAEVRNEEVHENRWTRRGDFFGIFLARKLID